MYLLDILAAIAMPLAVGVLTACLGEIRWWRYEASVWEKAAARGLKLAEEATESHCRILESLKEK